MSASIIEAEPDTCALLMVLMMLNLPQVGSFTAGTMHAKFTAASALTGRPTLAGSLAAVGCGLLPLRPPAKTGPLLRMSAAETAVGRDSGGWPAHVSANVANFWVLADKEGPPDATQVKLCANVIKATKAGGQISEALGALDQAPVAVELTSSLDQHRPFRFPGPAGTLVQVRETSFGGSGLGYAVWDAGIGLGI